MASSKVSIASTLTTRLREAILSGEVLPESRLHLESLGEQYGVSLSPVREALLRLVAEGFVVAEEQRGFRVVEASVKKLAEVTALRAHMEPFALRHAIERGDLAWEEKLVAVFHRLTRIEQRDEYVPFLDEWERTHREFHLCLVAGCDMPMVTQFCSVLHDQSDRYRRLFLKNRPPQRNVAQEHAAIMDAVLARDADLACDLLQAHSKRTGETVQAFMRGATN
ncbi:MAG: GntR family transcriptional regulator [Pigmentiphaga sp.]|uniref:GntR family transcriptional regulator n=1 Tax=Pigmentiphaga sp. TaxID=1977564 RepID=UPI0029A5EEE7|nr:GntR family transcriptional regulator [Pigmentiphaga sp.]MDX3908174.1 GntR family transcriptional regulator [Pigmentiphaga sp.]